MKSCASDHSSYYKSIILLNAWTCSLKLNFTNLMMMFTDLIFFMSEFFIILDLHVMLVLMYQTDEFVSLFIF